MKTPDRHIAALIAAAPPLTSGQVDTLRRTLTPPPLADVTVMPLRPRTSVRRAAAA